MFFYQICLLFLIFAYVRGQEQPTLKLNSGEIRGHYKQSKEGRTFSAFEGIPYAKPPIGDLRFAEPQPAEPWTGTWDATVVHTCMQLHFILKKVIGNEDCLYLNVYVPREKPIPNENLDVIAHIHGGAFMMGSPEFGGPHFLMDRDIIYVTLNYRLGPLGFLSTEDDVVPGNNGLKDQAFALKWIQDNIASFGGNPKSVTITGLSAGGASVHFHYFSPLSKGLFARGISQSGVATAPWAIQKAPLKRARRLAETVGCNRPSTRELIKCLRQRPASQFIENLKKLYIIPNLPLAMFAPVIEEKSKTAFLTEHPRVMLRKGDVYDVPWISSVVSEEGILGLMIIGTILDRVNDNWDQMAPSLFEYEQTANEKDYVSIAQKIREFYFKDEDVAPQTIPQLIKLFSDRFFTLDMEKAARMQAKVTKSPVYSYIFSYKAATSTQIAKKLFNTDHDFGVAHGADGHLVYSVRFMDISSSDFNLTEDDIKIKEVLVDMFATFAINGEPKLKGISWKPVSHSGDFGYLAIKGPDDVGMTYVKELGPMEFWESLPLNDERKIRTKDEL